MTDPLTPDVSGDPAAGELIEPADDGEQLVRRTTHEVEPGDMMAPDAT